MRRIGRYPRGRRKGFTLVEVLVVVMYIAIIAGMVLPSLTGAGRRASETNLRATLREMRHAIGAYQAETGLYPLQLDDLIATKCPPTGLSDKGIEVPIHPDDFRGPYLLVAGRTLPMDRTTGNHEWEYNTTPPYVGAIHSLNHRIDLDGQAYDTY